MKGLFWPPKEAKTSKLLFTNVFLLVYLNNNQSLKLSNYFNFDRYYGNENGHQNRLKIGN